MKNHSTLIDWLLNHSSLFVIPGLPIAWVIISFIFRFISDTFLGGIQDRFREWFLDTKLGISISKQTKRFVSWLNQRKKRWFCVAYGLYVVILIIIVIWQINFAIPNIKELQSEKNDLSTQVTLLQKTITANESVRLTDTPSPTNTPTPTITVKPTPALITKIPQNSGEMDVVDFMVSEIPRLIYFSNIFTFQSDNCDLTHLMVASLSPF